MREKEYVRKRERVKYIYCVCAWVAAIENMLVQECKRVRQRERKRQSVCVAVWTRVKEIETEKEKESETERESEKENEANERIDSD